MERASSGSAPRGNAALVSLVAVVGLSTALSLASGCSGGDDGMPDPGTEDLGPYGGMIYLGTRVGGDIFTESFTGHAHFREGGDDLSAFGGPTDTCEIAPYSSTAPVPPGSPTEGPFLDAGTTVVLTAGASVYNLERYDSAYGYHYYLDYEGDPPVGLPAAFSVAFDGAGGTVAAQNWPDALKMPTALSVTSNDGDLTVGSGALALQWTATGADQVVVQFAREETVNNTTTWLDPLRCYMKDDGSFSIPASFAEQLSTGTHDVDVFAFKRGAMPLGEFNVRLVGYRLVKLTYTK